MFGITRDDFIRHKTFKNKIWGILFDNGLQAVLLYRISKWLRTKKIPLFKQLSDIVFRVNVILNNAEISPDANIGKRCIILHSIGVVIGQTADIGNDFVIAPGAKIASRYYGMKGKRHATIGNKVFVGANSVILGSIKIGDNVTIAAGSVVTKDVFSNTIVAGVPARQLVHKESFNND